jgi:hypothetical protein
MIPTPRKSISLAMVLALSHTLLLHATQDSSRAQLAVAGQVARVDSVAKSVELKSEPAINKKPTLAEGITLGTTIGKTAPGQRSSIDPIDTSEQKLPANGPNRPPTVNDKGTQVREVRSTVFLTDLTTCKDGKKVILCGELKMNDFVQVTGDEKSGPRGFGIYATDISRTKQVR